MWFMTGIGDWFFNLIGSCDNSAGISNEATKIIMMTSWFIMIIIIKSIMPLSWHYLLIDMTS